MKRYEIVKNYVYSQYAKIYNNTIRIEALSHTSQVDTCATMLAMARNLDVELCKIIALLHDFGQFTQNCPHAEHARIGSILASKYLIETELFTQEEIDNISYAISQHSKKADYDNPFCECIKDADLLARFFSNPTMELNATKKQRLLNACADLGN